VHASPAFGAAAVVMGEGEGHGVAGAHVGHVGHASHFLIVKMLKPSFVPGNVSFLLL